MRLKYVFAALLLPVLLSAATDTIWSRRWTGPGRHDDMLTQIVADNAGYVYTAGIGWDSTTSAFAMVTAKYDSWGGLKWRQVYNAYTFSDTFAGIALDANSDVYVSGTVNFPARGKQIRTVKYNGLTGNQAWTAGYDARSDTSEDYFVASVFDPVNNCLYVAGSSYNGPRRKYDYTLIRYSAAGSQVWATLYNWPAGGDTMRFGDDVVQALCLGLDNDPVLTGYSWDQVDAAGDWQTVRFNRINGDTIPGWSAFGKGRIQRDPGNDDEWPYAVCAVGDSGTLFVTGFGYNSPLGYYNIQLVRHVGSTGDTTRTRRLNPGDDASWGKGIKYTDGHVVIHAYAYDEADPLNLSAEDWGVVCYDTSRSPLNIWAEYVDGGYLGTDEPWDMALDPQGRPYVTGYCEDTLTGWPVWRTIRYDVNSGARTLDFKYIPAPAAGESLPGDTFDNWATSIAIKDTNHIYLGGYINRWNSGGGGWDQDMHLVRFGVFAPSVVLDSVTPKSDTVDSGTIVTWRAFYHSNGNGEDSLGAYRVRPNFRLTIGAGYTSTVTDTAGAWPGQSRSVTFPANWSPTLRGTIALKCTVAWSGDTSPGNNRIQRNLFVRVRDVSPVLVLTPGDTVIQGVPFAPRVRITNYGNAPATFTAQFAVGTSTASANVANLAPGASVDQVFSPTVTPPAGMQPITVVTQLAGDVQPGNDTLRDSVYVLGGALVDVSCNRIVAPSGLINLNASVTPQAWVRNRGAAPATFKVFFYIDNGLDRGMPPVVPTAPVKAGMVTFASVKSNPAVRTSPAISISPRAALDAIVYLDSVPTTLGPGDSVLLSFRAWTAAPVGSYTVKCTTRLAGDMIPANDKATGAFTVRLLDAEAVAIVAPTGTVNQGATVAPRATVRNNSNSSQTFNVTFTISGGYTNTQSVTLGAGASQTLTFANWLAGPAGTQTTQCTTALAGDMLPANNAVSGSVLVQTLDAQALTIDAPVGTVNQGTVITPQATVRNNGNTTQTFNVRFTIAGGYSNVQPVTLAAGAAQTVSFANWTAGPAGTLATACSTELAGDMTPTNDKVTGSVVVQNNDVQTVAILAPSGTVNQGVVLTPQATVRNNGNTSRTFDVIFTISGGYTNTQNITLAAGATQTVSFAAWTANPPGLQTTACSTALAGDLNPANDKVTGTVVVQSLDAQTVSVDAPSGTVNQGTVIAPLATVRNNSNASQTFDVRFTITGGYTNTQSVTLAAGAQQQVTFADWTAGPLGAQTTQCTTLLAGDANPGNDVLTGPVFVQSLDAQTVTIDAPTGTIDQGTVVAPRATVRNSGNTQQTFDVRFLIAGGYADTQSVTLAAGAQQQVTFVNWTAGPAGVLATACSTALAGDMTPANDRVAGSVTVRYLDAEAVSIIAPTGTVDPGQVIVPQASVRNNGNLPATFDVTFSITGGYLNTQSVTVAPGGTATVSFANWTAGPPGSLVTRCTTQLAGDRDPGNDLVTGSVFVQMLDVQTVDILAPVDTVLRGTAVSPQATVRNNGNTSQTFDVRFTISGGYVNTQSVTLAPGATQTVTFINWTAAPSGIYQVSCTTLLAGDMVPANDAGRGQVVVIAPDVGATAIVAPVGTVDSGATVTPIAVARNFGDVPASCFVKFTIGTAYADSFWVWLPVGAVDTLYYLNWIASPIGTFAVTCSTMLALDIDRSNDAVRDSVRVIPFSGLEGAARLPTIFALGSPQPNPSRAGMAVSYSLPRAAPVMLGIYSATGKLVRLLATGTRAAGCYRAAWDGRGADGEPVGRGIYYCRLQTDGFSATRKVVRAE